MTQIKPKFNSVINHAGVLPYCIVRDEQDQEKFCFLLGQERPETNWADSLTYCSFGGKPEPGETIMEAAAREAYEESMGFLGTEQEILDKLKELDSKGKLMYFSPEDGKAITYLLPVVYQPNLPTNFANFYNYVLYACQQMELKKNKKAKRGNYLHNFFPKGFFEKVDIIWLIDSDLSKLVKREIRPEQSNLTNLVNNQAVLCKLRPIFAKTMLELYRKYPQLIGK